MKKNLPLERTAHDKQSWQASVRKAMKPSEIASEAKTVFAGVDMESITEVKTQGDGGGFGPLNPDRGHET